MLSHIFGCAVFLITNISLLYTSHLCVRRFLPHTPPPVRLIAIGILYYSFIILIFQVLSPFHAITKTWVTFSCFLLSLLSFFLWGKETAIQADIEPIRSWIRDGLTSRWSSLLVICGFVVVLSFSRALLMPPLTYDCLTYHLTFAALWIKQGTLLIFNAPDQIADCAHFPINGEIFAAWLLLPFHTDLLVNTMNFPLTLLGGISCYAIARELGLTRKEASFGSALICFAPVIYSQITTSLVDNASLAFYSASVLFTLRYLLRGHLHDGLLALVAVGILIGIKQSGIPTLGLIFVATTIKTIPLVKFPGFWKKFSLIILGLLIVCALGGRQYIINSIEARNPLYPFSLEINHHEIFEGSYKWEQVKEWLSEYEKERDWDKFSLWERGYRRLCYLSITAGPKFSLFFILALISLLIRPHHISKSVWYFLSLSWIVPIGLFYADTSANFARRGPWIESSTRFLSPYIALFTIQGLIVIRKIGKYLKKIDLLFVAFIVWDLLYINKNHIREIELLYPLVILLIPAFIILFNLFREKSKLFAQKKETFLITTGVSKLSVFIKKKWAVCMLGFLVMLISLYLLQSYRDSTRYIYYRKHFDHQSFVRLAANLANGWEFLDKPDEKKTIALTMDCVTPLGEWLFYPLFGRWLQNDPVYISAKYKREVPTWLHQGNLRGKDFSIWLNNLKEKKVDYIFVQKPWPIELTWMQHYQDKFQLMFSVKHYRIFKYAGEST